MKTMVKHTANICVATQHKSASWWNTSGDLWGVVCLLFSGENISDPKNYCCDGGGRRLLNFSFLGLVTWYWNKSTGKCSSIDRFKGVEYRFSWIPSIDRLNDWFIMLLNAIWNYYFKRLPENFINLFDFPGAGWSGTSRVTQSGTARDTLIM